ncbi:purine and uridine phosphorylase [Polychaeton citri CBS 116435]|uniref:Purine and uridine phosphorylase n=1 Tax=Polychaeton citri CBS 116435 TaxID=1314669 RepID=A0A9P4Q775_9PEZI|nr:purine and uridine phosphorylase [Polychaeton citri CBS 116435]
MSAPTGPESCEAYTVAWITALALERAAAVAMLDERYNDPPPGFRKNVSDDNAYSWGRVGKHNVVISSLPAGQYGTNATATIAQGLRSSLPHIRIGLLVGIGAGIPGTHFGKGNKPAIRRDIRLGDVVVSMPNGTIGGVVQIDLVKAGRRNSDGEEIVERKGFLNSPPMAICTALMKLQANHEIEDSVIPSLLTGTFQKWPKMKAHYSHPGIDRPGRIVREARLSPDIHYGIIASSNTLEKSAEHRDDMLARLKAENIEPMCLEMEAAGLMNGFPCLIIRGVCDYADEHKNDDWQKYAAVTAAAFAKELLGCTDVEEVRSAPEIGRMLDKS